MSSKPLREEFSPARKIASLRASLADELEGALERAVNLLDDYSTLLPSEVAEIRQQCKQAAEELHQIYKTFDEQSASESAETFDYRAAAGENEALGRARVARDQAIGLIEKLQRRNAALN